MSCTGNIKKRPPVYSPKRRMVRRLRLGFENINEEVTLVESNTSSVLRQENSFRESDNEDSQEQEDVSQCHGNTDSSSLKIVFKVFMVIMVLIIGIGQLSSNNQQGNVDGQSKLKEWQENIRKLEERFPSQNSAIWSTFASGIKSIVTENPARPSIILLLHDDEKTSTCLVHKLGQEVVKLLSKTSEDPIIIRGENLKRNSSLLQDYGLFTETYKDDLRRKHVMIVLNLQEIPAVVAQTFHSLCDVHNPVVHKAAYLFTMHVDRNGKNSPTQKAEKTLKALWKDSLDIDTMEPLIVRITDTVLFLNTEDNIPC